MEEETSRRIESWEYERALDSIAVHVLCRPSGCEEGKECPFDPMCAADLTPQSQQKLICAKVEQYKWLYEEAVYGTPPRESDPSKRDEIYRRRWEEDNR